ncbi:MAG: paraquat-inducible protein A [Pseudomonadota bacterium]
MGVAISWPMRYATALLTLIAALCLPLGWVLPLLQLERLYFFKDTPSLVDLVTGLWAEGDLGLSSIIVIVSFIFPLAKLAGLSIILALPNDRHDRAQQIGNWLAVFSKWSMLDVVLVALAIFAAKTSGLAAAISQPGIWFFTASTVTSSIAAGLIVQLNANKN